MLSEFRVQDRHPHMAYAIATAALIGGCGKVGRKHSYAEALQVLELETAILARLEGEMTTLERSLSKSQQTMLETISMLERIWEKEDLDTGPRTRLAERQAARDNVRKIESDSALKLTQNTVALEQKSNFQRERVSKAEATRDALVPK